MEGTREYEQKMLTRHKFFSLITKPNLALLWELFTQQINCCRVESLLTSVTIRQNNPSSAPYHLYSGACTITFYYPYEDM